MMEKELTCICCPMGCSMKVTVGEENKITVTGNTCPRGAEYAGKELTDPRRIVTSTVWVSGGMLPCVSVKTSSDIPKKEIENCIKALKNISVKAPVHIGQVILKDVSGTGADIIATKNIKVMEGQHG